MSTRRDAAAKDLTRCCYCGAKVPGQPCFLWADAACRLPNLPICNPCGLDETITDDIILAFLATEEKSCADAP